MPEYIGIDIDDDQATVREQITDAIIAGIPDWLPVRGGLIYLLADGVAFVIAELYAIFTLLTTAIFATYLTKMAGIPSVDATASTVMSTWTSSTMTFTVDGGTLVGIDDGAGGLLVFEVVDDVSTTDGTAENVELISQDTGEFTAGLTGDVTLLDAEVAAAINPTITLAGATAGGTDGETVDEYIARGSERLQLSSDDVIRGEDAAILARQVTGVWRAMAVDNYDVATDDDAAEGKIGLALMDAAGAAVSGGVLADVQALVDPATIVGLEVGYADPDPTAIDVTVVATALAGYDTADVDTRTTAAVLAFLAESRWGSLPFTSGGEQVWRPQTLVRYLEVAAAVNAVEGLDFITTLTVEGGTADVTLGSLPWSIAAPGTITVTINAPT